MSALYQRSLQHVLSIILYLFHNDTRSVTNSDGNISYKLEGSKKLTLPISASSGPFMIPYITLEARLCL